ncbi:MAG: hypothetical protein WCJ61_08420 [Paludibacter sp.]
MKKQIIILLLLLITMNFINAQDKNSVGRQLFRNINFSWDVNRTDDYRWRNFSLGTAYGNKFEFNTLVSWQLGLNYNWSKYTLYSDGNYSRGISNSILRTQSLTFPLTYEYKIYKSFFTGIKLFTGPVYELILSSEMDDIGFSGLHNSQLGWTVGTKIRFFAIFSTRIAYEFYPTGLFKDGSLNRSAVNFSLGF